jgi:hypothetical protein
MKLPNTIKQMRDNNYTVKAMLRLKDEPALVEEVDEIFIPDPYTESLFLFSQNDTVLSII